MRRHRGAGRDTLRLRMCSIEMQGTTAIHTIEGFEPEMTTLDSLEDEMQAQIRGREARLRPKAEAEAEPPAAAPVDPRPAFQPVALQKEELVLCAIPSEYSNGRLGLTVAAAL